MSVYHLTSGRIDACEPRKKTYIVRDRKLKGLCLAVNPGGSKTFFVESSYKGETLRERIGNAENIDPADARAIAREKIATFRRTTTALRNLGPDTALAVIADIAFARRQRLWKPRTMRVNREYLKLILPAFGEKEVGSITRRDVEEWHLSLNHIPGSANRAASTLSAIMTEAEHLGCRPEGSNPVSGLKRYKNRQRSRVPTTDEIMRLGRVLREAEKEFPNHVAFIRLLILTGCRKSEILELRWKDYRDGNLHLVDSKSGPKTVFLSSPARAVLEGLKTRRSKWVFPAKRGGKHQSNPNIFWIKLRSKAGLDWLRLHDLRHMYASLAVRNRVNLRMVGKLLGHGQFQTTMRYAHLDDATMQIAAKTATANMVASERKVA